MPSTLETNFIFFFHMKICKFTFFFHHLITQLYEPACV